MSDYTIRIDLKDVAEGDATDLAQQIHDEHGEAFDVAQGDFIVWVSKDGIDVGWEPR